MSKAEALKWFRLGWVAHSETDPEWDTMGFRPKTPEAALNQLLETCRSGHIIRVPTCADCRQGHMRHEL